MDIKSYFNGQKARVFWINVGLMVAVLIIVPVITLYYIDHYTHHGERIEVPNLDGMDEEDAQDMLAESGLIGVVNDSTIKEGYKPGTVCFQTPKAGSFVKDGRKVYLTIIRIGEAKVSFPNVAGYSTANEAHQILSNLGFTLNEDMMVESPDKGLVISVYQGSRMLKAGEMVSTKRPITLHVGSGNDIDTLATDDFTDDDIDIE